jgi:hypothetical protein
MYTLSGTSTVTRHYRGGGIPHLPPAVGATDGFPEPIINTLKLFSEKISQKNNAVLRIILWCKFWCKIKKTYNLYFVSP